MTENDYELLEPLAAENGRPMPREDVDPSYYKYDMDDDEWFGD